MSETEQVITTTPPPEVPTAPAPTVYAMQPAATGTTSYAPPAAPTVAPRQITEGETVEGRLSKLLSDDSAYVKQQEQKAVEYMAGRGGQNTTMAATAGRRAAIEGALPIVQQDAQTFSTAGQSSQEANQLVKTEGYRGGISSALSNQEAQQKIQLEEIAQKLTGDRQDKETYVKLSSGVQQEYQTKYLAIQQTSDTIMNAAAKQVALDTLNRTTKSQMDMLDAVYKVDTTWSGGISSGIISGSVVTSPATTTGAATAAPTVTGTNPAPWEAPASNIGTAQSPQSIINSGQIGTAENLAGLSADPTTFKQQLANLGAKESDDYWSFSSQATAKRAVPTGVAGGPGSLGASSDQAWEAYSAVQYAIANPSNAEAQAAAVKVLNPATGFWNNKTYSIAPAYVDPASIPPSQSLSAWQQWVNKNVYNNQAPSAPEPDWIMGRDT